jgi:protein O-mannosyl-transferase
MASHLKKSQQPPPKKLSLVSSQPLAAAPEAVPKAYSVGIVNLAVCVLLAVLTLGVYHSLGRNPFVEYDDQGYVTENMHVKAGLTWNTFVWALTATDASNWHPVTWWSHALDYTLYGMNAAGHHWTSLLIHVVNVILLFLLLWRATGAILKSAFVAALFALHPLNVESVAWIAERKNVLSTMFFFLSLGAYGWYAKKPNLRRYALLVLMFVLGLAAKPMVITLPFVLLLLDYWPLQRIENWTKPSEEFPVQQASVARLVLEKLPLMALSGASAVITIAAQSVSEVPGAALPFGVRLWTALYAYGMYVWKALWPAYLAVIYPHPGRTLEWWKPLLGALLIAAVSLVVWLQRRQGPYLPVGWLWYLGTAVPIIGLMQVGVQVIADRYAYVPLIGLFVMIAWTVLPAEENLATSRSNWVVPAVAALIVVVLGFISARQVGFWRSNIDLWTHALKVTKNNSMAESYLANSLFAEGRYEEGIPHLQKYASMEPYDAKAHARLAAYFQDHGELPEAAQEYQAAIRASAFVAKFGPPGLDSGMLAITYANLAVVYVQLGDAAHAAENGRNALTTDSDAVEQMLRQLSQMVAAHPTALGYLRVGLLLEVLGYPSEAQQVFARAQQLNSQAMPPASQGSTPQSSNGATAR